MRSGPDSAPIRDWTDPLGRYDLAVSDVRSAADRRAVDVIDRAWNEAYERNDRARLGPILAEDFEAVTADGQTVSKAQLMRPSTAPRSIAFTERSVRPHGSTAITRGRLTLEHDGRRIDQRFMRVYTKRGGRWWAVAVQVFPILE
jgi:ketosteroid isomerase-like protein